MSAIMTATSVLAATSGKTGEAAKAGPIGLVVIILLCVACWFLFKSMSKHLKKVREDFPDDVADVPERRTVTVQPTAVASETGRSEPAGSESAQSSIDPAQES